MALRILVTNDDGMHASQLIPLIRWCQTLGEVFTVVPKYEQSAKSHSIELHKAFEAKEVLLAPGISAWAVDSSPADCVRFAVHGLHKEFDLVVSGVNRGFNVGVDILYSGTVSAVMEAGVLGIPGIALSTGRESYETATAHLDEVWQIFQKHKLWEHHNIYNVNIPEEVKGYRFTDQGGAFYSDEFALQENNMYMPVGKFVYQDQQNLSLDTDAVTHGYISIMPLTLSRVNQTLLKKLQDL